MATRFGDSPTSSTRDFRHPLTVMEAFQQSADRGALTRCGRSGGTEQRGANVLVAKAACQMVAVQNGCEQADILSPCRIEAGGTAVRHPLRLGELPQLLVRRRGIIDD